MVAGGALHTDYTRRLLLGTEPVRCARCARSGCYPQHQILQRLLCNSSSEAEAVGPERTREVICTDYEIAPRAAGRKTILSCGACFYLVALDLPLH